MRDVRSNAERSASENPPLKRLRGIQPGHADHRGE
jgi:hypothetical protein